MKHYGIVYLFVFVFFLFSCGKDSDSPVLNLVVEPIKKDGNNGVLEWNPPFKKADDNKGVTYEIKFEDGLNKKSESPSYTIKNIVMDKKYAGEIVTKDKSGKRVASQHFEAGFVKIPNVTFKSVILATDGADANNDKEISFTEAPKVTKIIIPEKEKISDAKGIEAFENLVELDLGDYCQVSELDLSKNTKLTKLKIYERGISKGAGLEILDLSANKELKYLSLNKHITNPRFDFKLNISNCEKLTYLKLYLGNSHHDPRIATVFVEFPNTIGNNAEVKLFFAYTGEKVIDLSFLEENVKSLKIVGIYDFKYNTYCVRDAAGLKNRANVELQKALLIDCR